MISAKPALEKTRQPVSFDRLKSFVAEFAEKRDDSSQSSLPPT